MIETKAIETKAIDIQARLDYLIEKVKQRKNIANLNLEIYPYLREQSGGDKWRICLYADYGRRMPQENVWTVYGKTFREALCAAELQEGITP